MVVAGARLVLDTASPVSFAGGGSIALGGRDHEVPIECWAGSARRLSELLGEPVDGLLGFDLLAGRIVNLNCPAGRVYTTSDDAASHMPCWLADATSLAATVAMGVPIVQITINGRRVSAAVDTCASACFASTQLLEGSPLVGTHNDFHTGIGRFTTDLHLASIDLGNAERSARVRIPVAAIPPSLMPLLTSVGLAGILGGELLMKSETLLDFRSEPSFVLLSLPTQAMRGEEHSRRTSFRPDCE